MVELEKEKTNIVREQVRESEVPLLLMLILPFFYMI